MNYADYMRLKEMRGVKEERKEVNKEVKKADLNNYFVYLEEAEW